MNWDVVVLRMTTDTGSDRSRHRARRAFRSLVTQAYLHEEHRPGRAGTLADRTPEAIYGTELWTIDRHLTFSRFTCRPGGCCAVGHRRAGAPDCRCINTLVRTAPACRFMRAACSCPKPMELCEATARLQKARLPRLQGTSPRPVAARHGDPPRARTAAGDDYVLMTDPVADYSLEEAIRVGR